jgi:hypothetical protein
VRAVCAARWSTALHKYKRCFTGCTKRERRRRRRHFYFIFLFPFYPFSFFPPSPPYTQTDALQIFNSPSTRKKERKKEKKLKSSDSLLGERGEDDPCPFHAVTDEKDAPDFFSCPLPFANELRQERPKEKRKKENKNKPNGRKLCVGTKFVERGQTRIVESLVSTRSNGQTNKQRNRKKGENNFDSLAACCGVVVVGAPTRAVHQTQQQPCSLSLSSIPHNNNNNHTLFFFSLLSVCLSAVRAGPPTEREREREGKIGDGPDVG